MLVPAIYHKEKLEKLFAMHMYDDDMFLYNGFAHCNELPNLKPERGRYSWAIVDGEKVVGYFSYFIDAESDNVWSFGLYSFEKNKIIGLDVYRKMVELVSKHHRIEWRMIGGNPVQRHYDHFLKHFHGSRVILHDVSKDGEGKYRDEYIYEILNKGGQINGCKINMG